MNTRVLKMKGAILPIIVISCCGMNEISIAAPLTGQGSTMPSSLSIGRINTPNSATKIINGVSSTAKATMNESLTNLNKLIGKARKDPSFLTKGQLINSSVDIAMAAILKITKTKFSNGIRTINKKTLTNAITERFKNVNLKSIGTGVVENLVIDIVSDTVGSVTGSIPARGWSWFALKQSLAVVKAAKAGKNPLTFQVALAYEQAQLLGDVVVKDVAAYNGATKAIDAQMAGKIRQELTSVYDINGPNKALVTQYFQATDKRTKAVALSNLKILAEKKVSRYLNYDGGILGFADVLSANKPKIAKSEIDSIEANMLRQKMGYIFRLNSGSSVQPVIGKGYLNPHEFIAWKKSTSFPQEALYYSKNNKKAPFLASNNEKNKKVKSHTLTNPNNTISAADKKRNAERKRLIGKLSQKLLKEQKADRKQRDVFESNRSNAVAAKDSDIQSLQNKRDAKQRELDRLNAAAGRTETKNETVSRSSSSKVLVEGNLAERNALESTIKDLKYIALMRKLKPHNQIWEMPAGIQNKLSRASKATGIEKNKLFIRIKKYRNQWITTLENMSVRKGHYKTVSTPSTYTQQVTRLVGLTNAERKRQNQLILDLNNISGSLTNAYASLNTLNNQRYTTSSSLLADQQKLGKLVTNYLIATKTQIGITQGAQANYTYYSGLISFINNGWIITGDFEGTTTQTPPSVGMSMRNVNNMDGVFNGSYTIASKVSSDSSGPYNYLSWGLWSASNPATYAQNNGFVTSLVSGGEWVMGKVALAIPKQGSASYVGQLSGDFMVGGNPRSRGVMSGSINFNANFATNKLNGSLSILKNGSLWARSTITNGQVVFDPGNGGSAHIQGGLSGGSAGVISGGFFGKNGAIPTESGGAWWLRKANNTSASGIYRAKKQ